MPAQLTLAQRVEKRRAAIQVTKTKDYYENASLFAKMFIPDPELPISKRAWECLMKEWRNLPCLPRVVLYLHHPNTLQLASIRITKQSGIFWC